MDPSKRAQSVATLSSTKHLKKKNTANELSRSASTLVVSTTTEIKPKKTKKSKLTITDSTDSLLIDRSELQTPEPSGKKKTKTKKTTNSNDNTSPNAGDTTHHDTPNAGGKSADGHTKSPLSQSSSSVTKKLLKNQKHARSTSSLTTINSLDSDASEDEDREDQFRTLTTGGNTSSLARLIKHSRNRSTASLSDSTTFQTGDFSNEAQQAAAERMQLRVAKDDEKKQEAAQRLRQKHVQEKKKAKQNMKDLKHKLAEAEDRKQRMLEQKKIDAQQANSKWKERVAAMLKKKKEAELAGPKQRQRRRRRGRPGLRYRTGLKAEKRKIVIINGRKMLKRRPGDPNIEGKDQYEGEFVGYITGENQFEEGKEYEVDIFPDYVQSEGIGQSVILRPRNRNIKNARTNEAASDQLEERQIIIKNGKKMLVRRTSDPRAMLTGDEGLFEGEYAEFIQGEGSFEEGFGYTVMIPANYVEAKGAAGIVLRLLKNKQISKASSDMDDEDEQSDDEMEHAEEKIQMENRQIVIINGHKFLRRKKDDPRSKLSGDAGLYEGEYIGYIPGEEAYEDGQTYDVQIQSDYLEVNGVGGKSVLRTAESLAVDLEAATEASNVERRTVMVLNGRKMLLRRKDDPKCSLPGDEGRFEGEFMVYVPGEGQFREGEEYEVDIVPDYVETKGPQGQTLLRAKQEFETWVRHMEEKEEEAEMEMVLDRKIVVVKGKKMLRRRPNDPLSSLLGDAGLYEGEYMDFVPGEAQFEEGKEYTVDLPSTYVPVEGPNGSIQLRSDQYDDDDFHEPESLMEPLVEREIAVVGGKKMLRRRTRPGQQLDPNNQYEGELVDPIPDVNNKDLKDGNVYKVLIPVDLTTSVENGKTVLHWRNQNYLRKLALTAKEEPTETRVVTISQGRKMLQKRAKDLKPSDTGDSRFVGEYFEKLPGDDTLEEGNSYAAPVPVATENVKTDKGQTVVVAKNKAWNAKIRGGADVTGQKEVRTIAIVNGQRMLKRRAGDPLLKKKGTSPYEGVFVGEIAGSNEMEEGKEYQIELPRELESSTNSKKEVEISFKQKTPQGTMEQQQSQPEERAALVETRQLIIKNGKKMLLRQKGDPSSSLPGDQGKYEGEYVPYVDGEKSFQEGKTYPVQIPADYIEIRGTGGQTVLLNPNDKLGGMGGFQTAGDKRETRKFNPAQPSSDEGTAPPADAGTKAENRVVTILDGKKMLKRKDKDPRQTLPGAMGKFEGEYIPILPHEVSFVEGKDYQVQIPSEYVELKSATGAIQIRSVSDPMGSGLEAGAGNTQKESRKIVIKNGKKMLVRRPEDPRSSQPGDEGKFEGIYAGALPDESQFEEGKEYSVQIDPHYVETKGPMGQNIIRNPLDVDGGLLGVAVFEPALAPEKRTIMIKNGKKMLRRRDSDPLRNQPGDLGLFEGEYVPVLTGEGRFQEGKEYQVSIPNDYMETRGVNNQPRLRTVNHDPFSGMAPTDKKMDRMIVIKNGKKMLKRAPGDPLSILPGDDGQFEAELTDFIPGEATFEEGKEYPIQMNPKYVVVTSACNKPVARDVRTLKPVIGENGNPTFENRTIVVKNGRKMLKRKSNDPRKKTATGEEAEFEGEWVGYVKGEESMVEGKEYNVSLPAAPVEMKTVGGKTAVRDPLDPQSGLIPPVCMNPPEQRTIQIVNGKKMLRRRPNDPAIKTKGEFEGELTQYVPGEQLFLEGQQIPIQLSPDYMPMAGINNSILLRPLVIPQQQPAPSADAAQNATRTEERTIVFKNGKKWLKRKNAGNGQDAIEGEFVPLVAGENRFQEGGEYSVTVPTNLIALKANDGHTQFRQATDPENALTAMKSGEDRFIELSQGNKMLVKKDANPKAPKPDQFEGVYVPHVPGSESFVEGNRYKVRIPENYITAVGANGQTCLVDRNLPQGGLLSKNGKEENEKREIVFVHGRKMLKRKPNDPVLASPLAAKMTPEEKMYEGEYVGYVKGEEKFTEGAVIGVELPTSLLVTKGVENKNIIINPNEAQGGLSTSAPIGNDQSRFTIAAKANRKLQRHHPNAQLPSAGKEEEKEFRTITIVNGRKMLKRRAKDMKKLKKKGLKGDDLLYEGEFADYIPGEADYQEGGQYRVELPTSVVCTTGDAVGRKLHRSNPDQNANSLAPPGQEYRVITMLNGRKLLHRKPDDPRSNLPGEQGKFEGEFVPLIPGEGRFVDGGEYPVTIPSDYIETVGHDYKTFLRGPGSDIGGIENCKTTGDSEKTFRTITIKNGRKMLRRKPDDPRKNQNGDLGLFEGEFVDFIPGEAHFVEGKDYEVQIDKGYLEMKGINGQDIIRVPNNPIGDGTKKKKGRELRKFAIQDGKTMLLRKDDDPLRSLPGNDGIFEGEYIPLLNGEKGRSEGEQFSQKIDPDYITTISVAGSRKLRNPRELMGGLGGAGGTGDGKTEARELVLVNGRKLLKRKADDPRRALAGDAGLYEGEYADYLPSEHTFVEGQVYPVQIAPDYLETVGPNGSSVLRSLKHSSKVLQAIMNPDTPATEERIITIKNGRKFLKRRPNDPQRKSKGEFEGEFAGYVQGEANMKEGREYKVQITPDYVPTTSANGQTILRNPNEALGGFSGLTDQVMSQKEMEKRDIVIINGKKMLKRKPNDPKCSLPGNEGLYEGEFAGYLEGEENWVEGTEYPIELSPMYIETTGPGGGSVLRGVANQLVQDAGGPLASPMSTHSYDSRDTDSYYDGDSIAQTPTPRNDGEDSAATDGPKPKKGKKKKDGKTTKDAPDSPLNILTGKGKKMKKSGSKANVKKDDSETKSSANLVALASSLKNDLKSEELSENPEPVTGEDDTKSSSRNGEEPTTTTPPDAIIDETEGGDEDAKPKKGKKVKKSGSKAKLGKSGSKAALTKDGEEKGEDDSPLGILVGKGKKKKVKKGTDNLNDTADGVEETDDFKPSQGANGSGIVAADTAPDTAREEPSPQEGKSIEPVVVEQPMKSEPQLPPKTETQPPTKTEPQLPVEAEPQPPPKDEPQQPPTTEPQAPIVSIPPINPTIPPSTQPPAESPDLDSKGKSDIEGGDAGDDDQSGAKGKKDKKIKKSGSKAKLGKSGSKAALKKDGEEKGEDDSPLAILVGKGKKKKVKKGKDNLDDTLDGLEETDDFKPSQGANGSGTVAGDTAPDTTREELSPQKAEPQQPPKTEPQQPPKDEPQQPPKDEPQAPIVSLPPINPTIPPSTQPPASSPESETTEKNNEEGGDAGDDDQSGAKGKKDKKIKKSGSKAKLGKSGSKAALKKDGEEKGEDDSPLGILVGKGKKKKAKKGDDDTQNNTLSSFDTMDSNGNDLAALPDQTLESDKPLTKTKSKGSLAKSKSPKKKKSGLDIIETAEDDDALVFGHESPQKAQEQEQVPGLKLADGVRKLRRKPDGSLEEAELDADGADIIIATVVNSRKLKKPKQAGEQGDDEEEEFGIPVIINGEKRLLKRQKDGTFQDVDEDETPLNVAFAPGARKLRKKKDGTFVEVPPETKGKDIITVAPSNEADDGFLHGIMNGKTLKIKTRPDGSFEEVKEPPPQKVVPQVESKPEVPPVDETKSAAKPVTETKPTVQIPVITPPTVQPPEQPPPAATFTQAKSDSSKLVNDKPAPVEYNPPESEEEKKANEAKKKDAKAEKIEAEENEELKRLVTMYQDELWILEMEIRDAEEQDTFDTRARNQNKLEAQQRGEYVENEETLAKEAAEAEERKEAYRNRYAGYKARRKVCIDSLKIALEKAGMNPKRVLPRYALMKNSPLVTPNEVLQKLKEEKDEQNKNSLTRSASSLGQIKPGIQKDIKLSASSVWGERHSAHVQDFEKASDPLHTSNSMFIFARYYARQDRKAPFFPPTAYFTPNFFEDDEEETEEAKPKPPVRPTNAPPAASRLAQSSTADDDEDEKPASKFKTDLTAVPDSIPPDSSEDFKMAKSAQNRIEENAPRSAKDKDSSSGINRSDSELNMQKNLTASPQDSSNEDAIFALLKAADTSNLTPEEKEDLDEQVKKAKEDLWVLEMEIRDYDESERLIDRNLRRAETIRRKKQKEAVEAKDKFAKGEISEPEWKELEPYLETESQQKQREEKEAHEMEQRALTREAVLSDHRVRRKECIDRIVKSMVKVGLNPYYTLPRKALVPFSPLTHSPQLLKQIRDEQREATKMSLTRSTSSLALLNPKVQKPSDRPVTEIWSRQTINTLDEFADKNAPSFSSLSQFAFAGYYQRSHDRCPPIATTVYLTPNFSTSDEPTEDPKASASLDKSTSQSTDQPKSQSGIASPFRTDLTAAPDQIPPDENGPSKIVEAAIAKAGSNEAADETPHDGGITERVLPPNFKPSPAEPENEEKKVEDELISDAQRQAEAAQLSDEEKEELEKAIRAAREDLWVLEMEIRDYDEEERIVTRKIEKEKRRRERKEKEAAEAKELFQQGKITQAELDEKVKGLETPEEKAAREEQERERDEKRTAAQELVFEDHRIRRKACLDRIISSMRKAGLNPHHTLPRKALVDNSPLTTAPSILHKLREERMEQNKMSLTRSTSSLAMLNPKLQKKIEKPITKVFSKKITSDIVEFEDLMGSNYSSNSQFVFSTYYSNHHARSTKIPTLLWYSPECYAPPKSDSTAEENTTTPAEGKKDDSINSSIPSSSQSNPPAISTGSSSSDIPITGQQPSQPFRTDLTAAPEEIPPDA